MSIKCGNKSNLKTYIYAYNIGVFDTYDLSLTKSFKVNGSAELEVEPGDTKDDAEANVKHYLLEEIYRCHDKYRDNQYFVEFVKIYFGLYMKGNYGYPSDNPF